MADDPGPRPGRRNNRRASEAPRFAVLTLQEALEVTGLGRDELVALSHVETFTRIHVDGRREEALRVPTELVVS